MDLFEQSAIRNLHLELLDNLRPEWILADPDLEALNILDDTDRQLQCTPTEKVSHFLIKLVSSENCDIQTFKNMLKRSASYLVKPLEEKIKKYRELRPSEICREKLDKSKSFDRYNNMAQIFQSDVYKSQKDVVKSTLILKQTYTRDQNWNYVFACVDDLLDMERTFMCKLEPEPGTSGKLVLHRNKLFKEMTGLITKTKFPNHAESVYLARYASALALDGHIDGALKEAARCLEYLDLDDCCRANANVIYAYINVSICQYVQDKRPEQRGNIIAWIITARKQVENENEEVHQMWTRMSLMKEAFMRLGIGTASKDITDVQVTQDDIEKAKNCLETIRMPRYWDSIDRRREMLYYRAKAKIAKFENNLTQYRNYLQDAFRIAEEGNFQAEKDTIDGMLKEIQQQF